MINNWFDDKALQREADRIKDAYEEDDLLEDLEGLQVGEEEEEEESNVSKRLFLPGADYLSLSNVGKTVLWKRNGVNFIDSSSFVLFQHVDTTQGVDSETREPCIYIWGVTSEGASVAVVVDKFKPYFYAHITNHEDASFIRKRLEILLKENKPVHHSKCVLDMEPVLKRSLCGWAEDRPLEPMYKITMADCSLVSPARKALDYGNRFVVPANMPIQTFEANIPFELRYMVDHQMVGCGWIRLNEPVLSSNRVTRADFEFKTKGAVECIPVKEKGDIAPLRVLSFDIECKKLKGGQGFVKAEVDPVVCICVALEERGKGVIHQAIFFYCEKPTQNVAPFDIVPGEPPTSYFVYWDERTMLLAFVQYIRESDPDIFTGWNVCNFDWPYLFKRASALGISEHFVNMTRMLHKTARIKETIIQSKAFGMKKRIETTIEGRLNYDAMDFMVFGQLQKFRSYKLNAMSKELLGDQKVDVDYSQITPLHEGSDKDRSRLAYYCMKDTLLPLRILEKRMGLINGIEQARVTGVPLKWILGGQGRKTFSNILRFKKPEELVPTRSPKGNQTATVGGYVRKPIVGYYLTPVFTLDFASLYPSIMQAENICYSTVVSAQRANYLIQIGKFKRDDFNWPPGFESQFCFVKPHIRLGVLPDLLTQLLQQRAYVKGLQKTAPNKDVYNVLDNRQLAIKLCCNSVYGFLKAFILVDDRLMSAVTAWGQDMIKLTADIVVTHYKDNLIVDRKACEQMGIPFEEEPKEGETDRRPRMPYTPRIIYGDSVTPTTPVLLRIQPEGTLRYVNIEDVPRKTEWSHYENEKEFATPIDGLEIWSDQGFTPLLNIIRHKTQKRIFRVLTHTGCVSVTEDHSLLLPNGKEVKPSEVQVGDLLMHKDLPLPMVEVPADTQMGCFFTMGLFLADGCCGIFGKSKSHAWKISKQDTQLLERAREELAAFYPNKRFYIQDDMKTCHAFNLMAAGDHHRDFVLKWRNWFYTSRKQKKVPDQILNASIEQVRLFMEGYYAGDGYKKEVTYRFDIKGEIGAAGLNYLATRLGKVTTFNTRTDKPQIYRVTGNHNTLRKSTDAIKKIEDMGNSDDYVYDLTTGNHHFAAGIGRLVVHNTDSIMVDFGDVGVQEGVRLQKEAANLCTSRMKKPNKLEPESVKLTAIYLAPKMYASLEILTGEVKPTDTLATAAEGAKVNSKGLQSKRRDNALIGSETQKHCLKLVLKDRNTQGAIEYVQKVIASVLRDEVDLSKFVISKGLSKTDEEYKKGGTKQLHTELKKRMAARAKKTGEIVPETGDRVPFIMRAASKGEKSCDCSEDPLYAQKNRIPIDKDYYIDKQIMASTLKVFTAIFEADRLKDIKSSMSDTVLRTLEAYKLLFAPSLPHMLQRKDRKIGNNTGIEAFAVALPQCLYPDCGVRIEKKQVVCSFHADQREEAKFLVEERREALAKVSKDAWDRCRKCAGGGFDEVTCANTTCDNFFHRDRAVADLEDIDKDLELFNLYPPSSSSSSSSSHNKISRMEEEDSLVVLPSLGGKAKRLKNGNIASFFGAKK